MREFKTLAVEDQNGALKLKNIYVKLPEESLHPDAAKINGFTLVDGVWVRELTDDLIARELRHEGNLINRGFVSELPPDRLFRDAWSLDAGTVKVNMPKARKIHMDRIRRARDKRLAELDKRKYGTEYDGERQALRDLPQTMNLETATTPEELKAIWPALPQEN